MASGRQPDRASPAVIARGVAAIRLAIAAAIPITATIAVRDGRIAFIGIAAIVTTAVIAPAGYRTADDGSGCEAVSKPAIAQATAAITPAAAAITKATAAIANAAAAPAAAPTYLGRVLIDHRFHRRHIGWHRPGLRARTDQGGDCNENGGAQ